MRIAVPTETGPGERRVSLSPDAVKRLVGSGLTVVVQAGAGARAYFSDKDFEDAGALIAPDALSVIKGARAVLRVASPTPSEASEIDEGALHLSFLSKSLVPETVAAFSKRKADVFCFDQLPRISRAQSMDALSSQATVAGYRAALTAAQKSTKFFPMLMTAAGSVPPAKVLIMGVGVAGLQAIATCRRLGAVVRAYDVRAAAKEEAESIGATFVDLQVTAEGTGGYARELSKDELDQQRAALVEEIAAADIVITTAAVPGRLAPVLVSAEMVDRMQPGAIIVDLAADSGGNCEITQVGQEIVRGGATVIGMQNPASQMPTHASLLYARNVVNLLDLLAKDGEVAPNWDDEIVQGTCVLRGGLEPTQ